MPRRRNEQIERAIHVAARKIMLEQGYEAATYTALAQATGIARTTIQHYVPFKEALATDLMQAIADSAYRRAAAMLSEDASPLALPYLAGMISHGIYYSTPGLRRFLLDISTDRRLQYQIPPNYSEIALSSLGFDEDSVDARYRDAIIQAIGGIYDVHFVCVRENRFPNTQMLNETVLRVYARAVGIDQSMVDDVVRQYEIAPEQLLEIGSRLAEELAEECPAIGGDAGKGAQ